MPGERVILTYKDYEALPADGRRYEVHEGELSVTPAPSPRHQRILGNLNDIVAAAWSATAGSRGRLPWLWRSSRPPRWRSIAAPSASSTPGYQLVARAAGPEAVSLPPFPDLAFVPASLWP
jgi:hypothetical protein